MRRKLRGRPGNHGGDWRCWSEHKVARQDVSGVWDSRAVVEGLQPTLVSPRVFRGVETLFILYQYKHQPHRLRCRAKSETYPSSAIVAACTSDMKPYCW